MRIGVYFRQLKGITRVRDPTSVQDQNSVTFHSSKTRNSKTMAESSENSEVQ
jgi:hypothetical protein